MMIEGRKERDDDDDVVVGVTVVEPLCASDGVKHIRSGRNASPLNCDFKWSC